MTIDIGLQSGICALWWDESLFDYIIQVEGYEISVHKAIMASVSEYFRVMLNGSLLETRTNRVELKGQSVKAVSKLIKLIYTGDENIVYNSAMEIFGSAVYFQMTFVIQACVERLVEGLNDENCLEVLALFDKYSCDQGVEGVKTYLKSNYKAVVKSCNLEETPYEAVQVIPGCWGKSEWDLFLFLKHWVTVDYENRRVNVNDLMSQVRFSLIDQGQLEAIMEMEIFTSSDNPWCELVRTSVKYHNKPIHHKMIDTSVQAKTRGLSVPVIFGTGKREVKSFHAFEKGPRWVRHETVNAPKMKIYPSIEVCLEVNNFLIMCCEYDIDDEDYDEDYYEYDDEAQGQQQWNVFDPRTKKWSQLVKKTPRTGFAAFYHGEKLYVLGGQPGIYHQLDFESVTRSVEEYSFHTNSWQEGNRMPSPVMYHAACVYEDSVYVSGGWKGEFDGHTIAPATDVDCLDMTNGTWTKKAPMLKPLMYHKMNVLTLNQEDVIVIIDNETDSLTRYECEISYYQPATDQWTEYEPCFSPEVTYDFKWVSEFTFVQGNTVLFINIEKGDENDDGWLDDIHPDNIPQEKACLQWRFSEARENISEVNYPKCPSRSHQKFGAILSI